MIDGFITLIRKPRVLALFLATLFSLVVYATGQFIIRSSANDPQIQMAEDTAAGLAAGMPSGAITPPPGRVIGESLSSFTVIYDAGGNPTAGSANYKGALPKPPKGVFDYAGSHGQNRVTWQLEKGLRFATVIVPYTASGSNGYVMAARSLRESEARTREFGRITFFGWLTSILLIFLTSHTVTHHVRRIVSRKKKR